MQQAQAAIVGVNVGGVETFEAPDGRKLRTAIRKQPLDSSVLALDGFIGDASSEAGHHTPAKAVHIFPGEVYPRVEARLGVELPRPAFGENLTTHGLLEESVFVGDRFRVGKALIRVTQPTERCKTIGRRLGHPKILKILHEFEACGFYASVVEAGIVTVGDSLSLEARPQPQWSIKRLHQVMFGDPSNTPLVEEALEVPELSDEWKSRLRIVRGRASRGEPLNSSLAELD